MSWLSAMPLCEMLMKNRQMSKRVHIVFAFSPIHFWCTVFCILLFSLRDICVTLERILVVF